MTIKINGTNTTAQPSITGTDTDTGLVYGTDEVKIVTGGTDRVTVNNTGLGIGTTSPLGPFDVVSNSAAFGVRLRNRSNDDYGFLAFRSHNGSEDLAQIGVERTGANVANLRFNTSGSERMRILSTGGLTFNGDTATANALDDYEEGTWTPGLYVTSGTHPTLTITANHSSYTKVGSLVTFSADFVATVSSVGSGSGLRISLPFAPTLVSGRTVYSGGPQGRASTGLTLPNYELSWYYYNDGARLFQQFANGGETSLSPSYINSGIGRRFNIGGFYYVN